MSYTDEETQDARRNLAEILRKYPTVSLLTTAGKYGRNGHRTLVVSVYLLKDWNGTPQPVNLSSQVATATGYRAKWRGDQYGIAVQSGGAEAVEVFHALCRALEIDPYAGPLKLNHLN